MNDEPNYEMTSTVGSPYNMPDQEAAEFLRTNARRISGVFRLRDKLAAGFPWYPLGHVQHVKFVQYRDSHPLPKSQLEAEGYYLRYANFLDPQEKQA